MRSAVAALWLGGAASLLFGYAPKAAASVVIHEIAWMGTAASAQDEWIELHNSGDTAVSLDGWSLQGGDLSIPLSGELAAGAYAVLERTDDTTLPHTPAFLTYTGALPNSGLTLTLTRADGSVADQVAGGEDWSLVGGDNEQKETAQLTPHGWRTAAPTPAAKNAAAPKSNGNDTEAESATADTDTNTNTNTNTDAHDADSGDSDSAGGGTSHTFYVGHSGPPLKLTIDAPQAVSTHQRVTLVAVPEGAGAPVRKSLDYVWNFGNGEKVHGEETVSYRFAHAGTYVVTVEGTYRDHRALAAHTITVLPPRLSLARNGQGALTLHNDASYAVNVSGYTIDTSARLTLPEHTMLAPRASIAFSPAQLPHAEAGAILRDPAGRTVAALAPAAVAPQPAARSRKAATTTTATITTTAAVPLPAAPAPAPAATSAAPFRFPAANTAAAATSLPVARTTTSDAPRIPWAHLGLLAVITLGVVGVYIHGARLATQEFDEPHL